MCTVKQAPQPLSAASLLTTRLSLCCKLSVSQISERSPESQSLCIPNPVSIVIVGPGLDLNQ